MATTITQANVIRQSYQLVTVSSCITVSLGDSGVRVCTPCSFHHTWQDWLFGGSLGRQKPPPEPGKLPNLFGFRGSEGATPSFSA